MLQSNKADYRAEPILVSVSVSGATLAFLMASELVKYVIQVAIFCLPIINHEYRFFKVFKLKQ